MSKVIVVVLALLLFYLRLVRNRRDRERVCRACGQRNPPHLTHCRNCSARL